MAVLERSHQKTITTSILVGVMAATLIFATSIISQGSQLSDRAGTVHGVLGPIKIFELYKTTAPSGGYNAGINLSFNGISTLLAVGGIIGVLIGIVRINKSRAPR